MVGKVVTVDSDSDRKAVTSVKLGGASVIARGVAPWQSRIRVDFHWLMRLLQGLRRRVEIAMTVTWAVLLLLCVLPLAALPQVETATLKNGVPVYVSRAVSRMVSVRLVVQGGAAYLDEDTSGLERSAFEWMTYGSKKYSKADIDLLSYDKQFTVSSAASQDAAALCVTCIDKYTKQALDVMCDMFVNPAFSPDTLPQVMDGINSSLAIKKEDPESILSDTVSRTVYADHPYRVKSFVTDRSLPFITADNMKSLHRRDMDSRRIFVAAAGNITAKSLAAILNRTIGKIGAQDTPLAERTIPPITADGENVTITAKSLGNVGYMQWVAPGPAVTDDDAPAAMVASDLYTRELFNVVRETHGACYSAQSLCSVGKIGMAGVYLHSVSDMAHAAEYEKEARSLLLEGKIASAPGVYEDVADDIEGVKNAFLNTYYESAISMRSVASRMSYSISVMGDPAAYDAVIQSITSVTADQAVAAFKKYWAHGRWFAVVGPGCEDKVVY